MQEDRLNNFGIYRYAVSVPIWYYIFTFMSKHNNKNVFYGHPYKLK